MRYFLGMFLVLVAQQLAWTQIDSPNDTGLGGDSPFASPNNNTEFSNNTLTSPSFGLDNPEDPSGFGQFNVPDTLSIGVTKDPGIQFSTDTGLLTRKMDGFTPKYFTKDKEDKEEFKRNQYFGEFKSEALYIVLKCRDHEFVDGDRVKIFLNDKVMLPGILLEGSFREFELFLEPGINTVEIEALNQGASGPNTAEIMVVDDNGAIIFQNEWNLATGARASFIVTKPQE